MSPRSLKLMCVVAHPDDECFAFGGALALASQRDAQVYVVCLTDGQAATHRGDATTGAELGQIRRAEFAASCKILGVTQGELLDYQDGQLEFVDFAQAAGRIVQRIRSFQPDLVLTFGSDGGPNTHADHMMVSALTTSAFHWSGRDKRYPSLGQPFQPKRLFFLTTNVFLPDRQPPLPIPWSVQLDISSVFDRKKEAFRAHVSQAPLIEKTRDHFEANGAHEFYTLIATAEPQPATLSADLFEGLDY